MLILTLIARITAFLKVRRNMFINLMIQKKRNMNLYYAISSFGIKPAKEKHVAWPGQRVKR